MSLIDPHDLDALMGALTDRIREMRMEQRVGRTARGEIIAENHALRDQLDAAALAMWRAEIQAKTVAADHEREVRELRHQLATAAKTIERTSEHHDFWHSKAHRQHGEVLDRLAKTDAALMALCQLLGLDPTGDVVAQVEAREQARQRQLIDAVRAGVTTPGNALILVDHHHSRALFLGDGFDAAWLRFRADLRSVDGVRHLSADVVATLEPSHPVRRWIEAIPSVPFMERYSRELGEVPSGYTLHTLSDPDEVWALWT